MKGITVTSAAAVCCIAATTVSASLPSSTTTGTFGIVNNHAFAGLNSRGGAVGKFVWDEPDSVTLETTSSVALAH